MTGDAHLVVIYTVFNSSAAGKFRVLSTGVLMLPPPILSAAAGITFSTCPSACACVPSCQQRHSSLGFTPVEFGPPIEKPWEGA